MRNTRRTVALLVVPAIVWLGTSCEDRPDTPTETPRISASHGASHTGTYTVWSLNEHSGLRGPVETLADLSNLSGHLASGPVMITAMVGDERGLSGNVYWNPVTNAFAFYDVGDVKGLFAAIDLDRRAIPSTGLHGSFGGGNVWATVLDRNGDFRRIYVQFRRDAVNNPTGGNMRRYSVPAAGIRVNVANGKVYLAAVGSAILELDPATNAVKTWLTPAGVQPHFLVLDALGRVYATASFGVADEEQIIRLDPGTNVITTWDIPGGGLTTLLVGGVADYIVEDLEGNLWFSETRGNEYGRLNPVTNVFEEFTKAGISHPHGIGTSGLGLTLQMYGQEADGNTTDILTHSATLLTKVTTFVTPKMTTVTPTTSTASFQDFVAPRTAVSITPATFTSTSSNGSGIDRFPQPLAVTMPTGLTGVVLPNTILGSATGSDDVEMFVSREVIIAPPPPPVCPPDVDDDNDGLNNSNESVVGTLVGIADSDGDGVVDGNDDANGNGKDDEDEDDDDQCPDPDRDRDGIDDEDEDDDDDKSKKK